MTPARAFPETLPGFQGMVFRIFGNHIDTYYLPEETILVLRDYVGRVEQAIENGEDPNIYVLDLFRWFICLCNQLGLSLRTALWNKYPGVCPYCRVSSCSGHGPRKLQMELLKGLREQKGKPRTIRGWQRLFERVFSRINARRGRSYIIIRLLEEISEAADLLREPLSPLDDEARELEIADVGAWVFGLATFLDIELEPELLQRFPWVLSGL
jgi:NTP pyrophosphatase (non-canonical NTP hydrolase)